MINQFPGSADTAPKDATPWHTLAGEDALRELETGPEGLARAEAALRLERHGPNEVESSRASRTC